MPDNHSRLDLVQRLLVLQTWLSTSIPPGPKCIRLSWIINFQKGGTLAFVLGLMVVYDNFSMPAAIYLALHGSYGLLWLLKEAAFPDPRWQTRSTVLGAFAAFAFVLGPYWLIPWLLVSGTAAAPVSSALGLASIIILHTLGAAIMLTADAQKYFMLRQQGRLITDGLFRRVRHPNYLGEMMIYGSYALLVQHWLPWAILLFIWLAVFAVNIISKERSLSRYPEWPQYRAATGVLLPGFKGFEMHPTHQNAAQSGTHTAKPD